MLVLMLSLWMVAWAAPHPPDAALNRPGVVTVPVRLAQEPPPDPAEERNRNLRVAIALIVAIVCSSAALGIAFGIRRRIDEVAGPPPDDEDD